MNLAEIEKNVAGLDFSKGFDLVYDLLLAYGLPKSGVTLLRKGSRDLLASSPNEHLWKGRLYYRFVDDGQSDLYSLIDSARGNDVVDRAQPRFVIVRDFERLLAVDTRTELSLDIAISALPVHSDFFMPWAGVEKAQLEQLNFADVKAAEKMARLYDEIVKHNSIDDEIATRNLNVFFSRLLFCFFAEDTGVFPEGAFTDSIASLTQESGTDTGEFLDRLFKVLATDRASRSGTPAYLDVFDYVNGRLFEGLAESPTFSAKARRVILECGTLDWSRINPDIFGSMIQAVVHPSEREGLGMHYTSVENIMKVIRPQFLDDFDRRFRSADTIGKLERLLSDICDVRVFDPACGSGNFLVIAYKELRRLEHRILQRIGELNPASAGIFKLSGIQLDHFFGIEIDDFAHEIAILSLWLAKHQMNVEFHELFKVEIPLIPLRDTGKVVCGNAARMDWAEVCPPNDRTFVCGNPPYQYGTKRTPDQSVDVLLALDDSGASKYLDYVSIWLYKGAQFAVAGGGSVAFVTTNSICQGKQVGLLWPRIAELGAEIAFAHDSFKWTNSAKGNAGVTCVIIGLAKRSEEAKKLYSGGTVATVKHINPYLLPREMDVIVNEADRAVSPRPEMHFGSMARDGQHFQFTVEQRAELIAESPEAERFILPFVGSKEFIDGSQRFCLWIRDADAEEAGRIPGIRSRLDRVAAFRAASKAKSTRDLGSTPHRFGQISFADSPCIIVPRHSSERREYVPIGFLPRGTVASDAVLAIYDASPWLFALITSRMHMAWLRVVGGKLKTDYRYSKTLVYNTFPFPEGLNEKRDELNDAGLSVLSERERHSELTLKQLYSSGGMPPGLRKAHADLDDLVDSLYQAKPFKSDVERLDLLLDRYSNLVSERGG